MKSKPTTVQDLASKLHSHLVKRGMSDDEAYRRVAIYYDLGGVRGASQHP